MKPGAHLPAFGGARTFHRMGVAIEDAGLELRDTMMWLYGQGFPKSHDVSKAIESNLTTGKSNSRSLRATEQAGDGEPYTLRGKNRSEEHTSELQSRENLVCRLLLEKKKKK